MTSDRVCARIEVTAGILPGYPFVDYTRRWSLPADVYEEAEAGVRMQYLSAFAGQAQAYAHKLMLQPERVKWVSLNWVWV